MLAKLRDKYCEWKTYKADLKINNKGLYALVDFVESLVVSFAIVLLIIRPFFVQSSMVYSGSMIPTMGIGDRLIVNKLIYSIRTPDRGEIILFKSPHKDKKEYVKRLIGMPGEKVEIKRGVVFIDGEQLVLPGIDVRRDYTYFGPEIIPQDSYFVLGDNRGNSSDSRFWGFVPGEDLIGKAVFTFWPLDRIQVLH